MRPVLLFGALLVALLTALAATPVLIALPPVSSKPAAQGEFDAARAKARLEAILGNQQPHPADSFGNDAVRARLVAQIRAMGLNPIVRDQFACNAIYKQRGVTCARVRNVIVALGPPAEKALLLNAHYDSTPVGPAAADDGAGVATLLEVASLLKTERLQRPVLFLFNEGEELGLVGARAFMADPLSGRVDSLVNLEARGVSGPVTMFETSLPNGPAVRAFARAVDRPYANSLATEFYRQLPNYTDVNSFSERGWLTLNFAMIGNEIRYHSPGDRVEALDLRSLKHMGDQALAVTRQLAAGRPAGNGNLLFADVAGRQLVLIPQGMGFILLGLLTVAFAAVTYRRGGMRRGLAVMAAALAGSAAIAWVFMELAGSIRAGDFWRGYPLWTGLAVYGCGLVAAVAALAFAGRKLGREQIRAAYWLSFLLLGVAVLAIAPGGVVYFLLPPLVALGGIAAGRWLPWAERAGAIGAATLVWLTIGEVLALLGLLLSNGPFFIFAPLAVLVVAPWLIEARPLLERMGRWPAVGVSGLLALLCGAVTMVAPAYSSDRQQRFVIQHVTTTASGKSSWLVLNDGAPLPQNFGGISDWQRDEYPLLERKGWIAPAPGTAVQPPRLERLGEHSAGGSRTVRFRIDPRGTEAVTMIASKDSQILSAGSGAFVFPISRDAKGRYFLTCFGRHCSGATMEFTTRQSKPLLLTLVGTRRGLPAGAAPLVAGRPNDARPQYSADSTLTVSRIRL